MNFCLVPRDELGRFVTFFMADLEQGVDHSLTGITTPPPDFSDFCMTRYYEGTAGSALQPLWLL